MAATDLDIGTLIDSMAQSNGVAIEPQYRDAVIAAMAATYESARVLLEFPLDEAVELAGVYEP